jgi:cytochrome c553
MTERVGDIARRMSRLGHRRVVPARRLSTAAVLVVAMLAMCPASSNEAAATVQPSASYPPGDPARGEKLAQTCAACHGDVDIKVGDPPIEPPKLYHERASYVFDALLEFRSGLRKSDVMTPMAAGLSDQDMRDIAAYVAAKPLGPPHASMVGTPAYKFTVTNCTICHGETGMGEMEGMPILTGQNKDYLEHALEEFKAGTRTNATMQAVAKGLTQKEIDEAATYYSAQEALEKLP